MANCYNNACPPDVYGMDDDSLGAFLGFSGGANMGGYGAPPGGNWFGGAGAGGGGGGFGGAGGGGGSEEFLQYTGTPGVYRGGGFGNNNYGTTPLGFYNQFGNTPQNNAIFGLGYGLNRPTGGVIGYGQGGGNNQQLKSGFGWNGGMGLGGSVPGLPPAGAVGQSGLPQGPAPAYPTQSIPPLTPLLEDAKKQALTANQANEARYAEVKQGYGDVASSMAKDNQAVLKGFTERQAAFDQGTAGLAAQQATDAAGINQGYQARADAATQGYANLGNQITADNQQSTAGYQQRLDNAMKDLEGAGDTERGDIEQRYDQLLARNRQRMISAGLGNTTVGTALDRSVTQDTTREIGALNERIRQQRLGVQSSLSGDMLQAQQAGRQLGYGVQQNQIGASAGLQGDTLTANQRMLDQGYGIKQAGLQGSAGLSADLLSAQQAGQNNYYNTGMRNLDFIERRNDVGPDMNMVAQLSGQYGLAQQAQQNALALERERLMRNPYLYG